MEFAFQEDEDSIFTRVSLKNVEVDVISFGQPDDFAAIIVRLPVRAAPEFRAQAGEFLHRLNYATQRKFWERIEWSAENLLKTGMLAANLLHS